MNKLEKNESGINEKINVFLDELENEKNSYIAIKRIEQFSSIVSNEYSNKNSIFNKILKWYVEKLVSRGNKENALEKIFEHEMFVNLVDLDNLKYLLSQNIDLQYKFYDLYVGGSETIAEKLAFQTKDKEKMKLVLEKIGDKLYYFDTLEQSVDLCRMNIIAGNLEKAFEIFKSDEYKLLLGNSYKLERESLYEISEGIHIDEFNPAYDDMLPFILKALRYADVSNELKEDFLKRIIYSNKIKFFNIGSIETVNAFVSEDIYNSICDYLYYKSLNRELTLFRAQNTESSIFNHSLMFFVSPKEFKEKTKGISLKK